LEKDVYLRPARVLTGKYKKGTPVAQEKGSSFLIINQPHYNPMHA